MHLRPPGAGVQGHRRRGHLRRRARPGPGRRLPLARRRRFRPAAATIAVDQTVTATASCSRPALQTAIAGDRRRVTDLEQLRATAARYRQQRRRIVFTNGCFDLLHRGHVAYLNQAKTLGDVLIVAVNADASVRRLKGPGRPLNTLEDRMAVLAALSCIDHLVTFEDDSPVELLNHPPRPAGQGRDYWRDSVPEGPLVETLADGWRSRPISPTSRPPP